MKYPLSMALTIVVMEEGAEPHSTISVGEQTPSPIRIHLDVRLPVLDSPENLQDFARQALAALCEEL